MFTKAQNMIIQKLVVITIIVVRALSHTAVYPCIPLISIQSKLVMTTYVNAKMLFF